MNVMAALATSLSRSAEWEAGVILATMAFTVVFAVLSILAVSLHVTSKALEWRLGRKGKRGPKKPPREPLKPGPTKPKPLTHEDLEGAAIAAATMHHTLKVAAALAALHHHIRYSSTHKVKPPQTGRSAFNAWLVSWLNEASLRPDINPYLNARIKR
ncbi:MAG: OadG family protein [Desulfurococcales archaeon]|nr:OadG family protein [Desulfurococcales archaeon]